MHPEMGHLQHYQVMVHVHEARGRLAPLVRGGCGWGAERGVELYPGLSLKDAHRTWLTTVVPTSSPERPGAVLM